VHFYQDNIYETTLKDALYSEFFKEVRKRQPFCKCSYTPCLLDCNIDIFKTIIEETKPKSSHKDANYIIQSEEFINLSKKYRDDIVEIHNTQNIKKIIEGFKNDANNKNKIINC
jgi:hypothetical protein